MDFDHEEIEATQPMSDENFEAKFALVTYVGKLIAPGNQGPEETEEETPKEESGYDSDNVFSDCQRSTNQRPPVHLGKWETTSSHVISSKGQNQNNYETRRNLASEIEIETSDGTAPKVMTSSAEAVASPKSEIEKLINKLIGGETAHKVMTSSDKAMTSSVVHPGNQKPDSVIHVEDTEEYMIMIFHGWLGRRWRILAEEKLVN
jgi:hypothetical protein